MEDMYSTACTAHKGSGFLPGDPDNEYMPIEWADSETGELFKERVWSNARRERQETAILELLHEISHLVRRAIAEGIPICTDEHPVDIGFCFNDDSPMHEMFRGGYKVDGSLLDEWDDIERLIRLLA